MKWKTRTHSVSTWWGSSENWACFLSFKSEACNLRCFLSLKLFGPVKISQHIPSFWSHKPMWRCLSLSGQATHLGTRNVDKVFASGGIHECHATIPLVVSSNSKLDYLIQKIKIQWNCTFRRSKVLKIPEVYLVREPWPTLFHHVLAQRDLYLDLQGWAFLQDRGQQCRSWHQHLDEPLHATEPMKGQWLSFTFQTF